MSARRVTWDSADCDLKYTLAWAPMPDRSVVFTLSSDDYLGGIARVSMTDADVDDVMQRLQQARDAAFKWYEEAA